MNYTPMWPREKVKYQCTDNTKIGIKRGNFYQKTKRSPCSHRFLLFSSLLFLGGLPPFLGFWTKWIVIQSVINNWSILIISTIVILSLITSYYYLWIFLFWLRKTSVSVQMYQLSFHVFICGFHLGSLHFLVRVSPFLFLFLCYPYFSLFCFHMVSFMFLQACDNYVKLNKNMISETCELIFNSIHNWSGWIYF